jgi:hypothetical protein
MPVHLVEIMTPLLVLAAIPLLLLALRRMATAPSHDPILPYLTMIVSGIILNILICGAVSTPHDRYLMRLIWLLPLCAVMLRTATLPPKA